MQDKDFAKIIKIIAGIFGCMLLGLIILVVSKKYISNKNPKIETTITTNDISEAMACL